jgi:hypothetical protein
VATVSAKNSIKRANFCWNNFWRIESAILKLDPDQYPDPDWAKMLDPDP